MRGVRMAALLAAGALTGCGGLRPIGRTRALAFARAVNLRAADVPGMATVSSSTSETEHFVLTPGHACGSEDRGTAFSSFSAIFRRTGKVDALGPGAQTAVEGLHSRVTVMRSAAEQSRDFAAAACDARRITPRHRGVRYEIMPSPLSGVQVRSTRTWREHTKYVDRFAFVVGAAEVVLGVSSAPRPPDAALERRLLSLLYRRATAHSL